MWSYKKKNFFLNFLNNNFLQKKNLTKGSKKAKKYM